MPPANQEFPALPGRLHVDDSEFASIRRGDGVYIDKTPLIAGLLTGRAGNSSELQKKQVFLARRVALASPFWFPPLKPGSRERNCRWTAGRSSGSPIISFKARQAMPDGRRSPFGP